MKILKETSLIITSFLLLLCSCHTDNKSLTKQDKNDITLSNVYDLAKRILENRADNFVFEQIGQESSADFFEISERNGKILIKGKSSSGGQIYR